MDKNDITNLIILLKWISNDVESDLWDEFEYVIKGHALDRENLTELIYKLENLKNGSNKSI